MQESADELWSELAWFVRERAVIAARKARGLPAPWTDDLILQSGKFGNVWRELDRGTVWERTAIKGLHLKEAARLIMLYRHCLVPRTTMLLLEGACLSKLLLSLDDMPVVHDPVKEWPGIDARSRDDAPRHDWVRLVIRHRDLVDAALPQLLPHLHRRRVDAHALHELIMHLIPTLGPFKAYEVVTSLAYVPTVPLDGNSLAFVGHGAAPALSLVTPEGTHSSADLLLVSAQLSELMLLSPAFCDATDLLGMPRRLTVRAVEDCLCEWRKWREVRAGTRQNRPRRAADWRF